jgi:NAD(P)-dependent dehydrogenase (short-subunit alcohol dehydrogenase family)
MTARALDPAAPRPGSLAGRVAVVTGAGSQGDGVGTGRAIAVRFAREGSRVCLVDRDEQRAEETLGAIAQEGEESLVVVGDVTSDAGCRHIVEEVMTRWARIDILVNNVGITGRRAALDEVDIENWDHIMRTNLRSAVLMTGRVIRPMIATGGGSIVNISSIGGMRAGGNAAYGPSKAALIALTRETAVLHGRDGVRCNAIAPGHINTPMAAATLSDPTALERRRQVAPLGVEGTAWDVAGAAVFLAGDDARFVTGVCLPVDGGVTAVGALAAHRWL